MDENQDVISELLVEYRECRASIKKMITDMEILTDKLLLLFPNKIDARYKYLFEEKIRTASELYKTLLDMKKEFTKSIKDEIELRRKIISKELDNDEDIDIRSIANKIQDMFKNNTNQVVVDENFMLEKPEEDQGSIIHQNFS